MIAEFAGLTLLAHDKGWWLRWNLPCPFAQPIDGLGDARIQGIEFHTLRGARERHDQAERWTMAVLLTNGITRKCEAGLIGGRGILSSDDQMRFSLPTLLAVGHGIACGLKIPCGNGDGRIKRLRAGRKGGKISRSPFRRPLSNDGLVFVRVRFRAAPKEKERLSGTVVVGLDQMGRNQGVHNFASKNVKGEWDGTFPLPPAQGRIGISSL
jgi:hypothetical protein